MRCARRSWHLRAPCPGAHAEHQARCRGAALPAVVQRRGVRPEEPGGRTAGERSGLPAREEDAPPCRRARGHAYRWSGRQGPQPCLGHQPQQPDWQGALGLPHFPRPQGREPAGRAVGQRRVDARSRALGRQAPGARPEGLGTPPRGLRPGRARPRDGRPDERRLGRPAVGGQGRPRNGDRRAEPAAQRRRGAGAADAAAQHRQQEGQEGRPGDLDPLHRGPPRRVRPRRAPQAHECALGGLHAGGRTGVLRLPPAAEGAGP